MDSGGARLVVVVARIEDRQIEMLLDQSINCVFVAFRYLTKRVTFKCLQKYMSYNI
ncbi:MAG: hypothetical protein HKUEN02_21600 [Anaerolineaceae bacterium]|nr:MAG: hypothetical protein HKUEN02_21600 [Anaerolineaceae bacterium]